MKSMHCGATIEILLLRSYGTVNFDCALYLRVCTACMLQGPEDYLNGNGFHLFCIFGIYDYI